MWWAIAWPLLFAVWVFLFTYFACCFRRCQAPARRSFKWVSWLSVAACGLMVAVSLAPGFEWAHLYFRGHPARAEIVSTEEEYDPILERSVTRVTYQFEAEEGGRRRQFRREGELRGRYLMVSGFINVLYDPADPAHSRMTREFHGLRNGMTAAAVFLALGAASFWLLREPRRRLRPLHAAEPATGQLSQRPGHGTM